MAKKRAMLPYPTCLKHVHKEGSRDPQAQIESRLVPIFPSLFLHSQSPPCFSMACAGPLPLAWELHLAPGCSETARCLLKCRTNALGHSEHRQPSILLQDWAKGAGEKGLLVLAPTSPLQPVSPKSFPGGS